MGQKPTIGYLRVSTDTEQQLSALENQRSRITAAGVDRLIEDVESGLSQDRPGYMELLRLIDTRSIAEVICTRVDRLGRDAAATDALIAIAAKRKVTITCLDGGRVEAETPQGFLLSRIATSMAEVESRMLSMRVKAGLAEGRKAARPIRGKVAWGYRLTADRAALEPDPIEFPRAQHFLQVLKAHNWRMSQALDHWNEENYGPIPLGCNNAVRPWLLNPVLRGGLGYYRRQDRTFEQVIWDTHPPLLDHSDFQIMERQLQDNKRRWGRTSHLVPHLLTGLCVCGACGNKMTYVGKADRLRLVCKKRSCDQRYKGTLESTVREHIAISLSQRNTFLAQLVRDEEDPATTALRKQIADLEAVGDPDLAPAIALKRARLEELKQQAGPSPEMLAVFADPAVFSQLDDQELRELLLALVEKVVLWHTEVQSVVLRL